MNAPDVKFYQEQYGGDASEATFNSCLRPALAHVNWLIGFNEVTEETAQAYMFAVCSAIDARAEFGSGGVGFSIGSFSVSGIDRQTVDAAMTDAAKKYLVGTGLLYQGVG